VRAFLDGAWEVKIKGSSPSTSTFTLNADDLDDSDIFATPVVIVPSSDATGVPLNVVFKWNPPAFGPFPPYALHVNVDLPSGGSDDAFLKVDATSWDPLIELEAGLADFDIGYYVTAASLVSAINVTSGSIVWGLHPHPFAPSAYPGSRPLVTLGGWTEVAFTLTAASPSAINFADYFPLTSTKHGLKTFQATYGVPGTFQSAIGGVETVSYGNGARIAGTYVTNFWPEDALDLLATNDGKGVQFLGTRDGYLSASTNLSEPPRTWYFGSLTNGQIIELGTYYFLEKPTLNVGDIDADTSILFAIQNVTVLNIHERGDHVVAGPGV
jgi:hypothetical protein